MRARDAGPGVAAAGAEWETASERPLRDGYHVRALLQRPPVTLVQVCQVRKATGWRSALLARLGL